MPLSRLKNARLTLLFFLLSFPCGGRVLAQTSYELNSGWKCALAGDVHQNGHELSTLNFNTSSWMQATVPGTVLTTLVNNNKVPDPFIGLNNELIPDIYKTGAAYYTYWFIKDFTEAGSPGGQTWLNFRGVNYSCDIYLNGHQLNTRPQEGMFLRFSYNITPFLTRGGKNRLAVLVHPQPVLGNPNGGQGGDGTIARNISLQYTAGWDWIQPVRDRNTGIWDKVTLVKTGAVRISDPHIVTLVPGIRQAKGPQQPALIQVSATLSNPASASINGILSYELDGKTISRTVLLGPASTIQVSLPDLQLLHPRLWWPNGYGPQNLYALKLKFTIHTKLSDQQTVLTGIRQLSSEFNTHTGSRLLYVNGQKIFIKGGNWIISDEMLRFSDARYDAEVRFHRDMNLNLIRVWGGAMIERPEFYAACDKYGMLVFQDLWGSGDCNGRWQDPMKLDDQWTRRKYPDDHALFLASAADQIKMVRNHASLAVWCGGNEITPPEDILTTFRDTLLPRLDNTRWFVDYSNSDEMSHNTQGGNGDGPYGIQPLSTFWGKRTFPFNSEVGSVGIGDYESLKRFLPADHMVAPTWDEKTGKGTTDKLWEYHKYIGYDSSISKYGKARDVEDFAMKAQLVNYDQYRGLAEGFTSHMWDWYTGFIIWKTQNPWTAMRGQMYDYYLDPNACLYGLHNGSEPFHIMYNPVSGMVIMANNTFTARRSMMLVVKAWDMAGKDSLLTQVFIDIGPTTTKSYFSIKKTLDELGAKEGVFLSLQVLDTDKKVLTSNVYWLGDRSGNYSGLQQLKPSNLQTSARYLAPGKVELTLAVKQGSPLSFFNRISLVDPQTKARVLPVFYSDNYVTVLPGEEKKIILEVNQADGKKDQRIEISGWNLSRQVISIDK